MDNIIHIKADEIRKLPDNSICDCEIIRQIALLGDNSLFCKIKKEYEVCGLYPHVMSELNIKPEKNKI